VRLSNSGQGLGCVAVASSQLSSPSPIHKIDAIFLFRYTLGVRITQRQPRRKNVLLSKRRNEMYTGTPRI